MANELAFALINPYTISKSRTGGVIGRIITRTGLEVVAARMFGPSQELTDKFVAMIRDTKDIEKAERELIADYVAANYGPEPKTGRRRRVMMLLFEGPNAVEKVAKAVGSIRASDNSGETVRDTFGDYVVDASGKVQYFEPAVMMGRTPETVAKVLKLWCSYSAKDGGLISDAIDVGTAESQRTLVIIKPDNFKFPSARPGNIIDIFSASGLRIIGAKVHRMSVAEAEDFYGPVQAVLQRKLKAPAGDRAAKALAVEFGLDIDEKMQTALGELIGPTIGDQQFHQIIQFMTGYWPPSLSDDDKKQPGKERCLVLIYSGKNAVEKIRKILGPTDPSKAEPGSVRKEFGKDIMINAAHASDSPESCEREMKILKVEQDIISPTVAKFYK